MLAQTEAEATKRLEDAGLDVATSSRRYSDTVKRGTVISTDPEPGDRIRDNDTVTLTISKGPETVKVPDLKGYRLDKAKAQLKDGRAGAGHGHQGVQRRGRSGAT